MDFYNGHFGGMHLIWWFIWLVFLGWIFFIPSDIPYQKSKKEDPLDLLRRRFANGEITKEEFEESMRILKSDNPSKNLKS